MKSALWIAAVLILVAAAQPTLAPRMAVFGARPDLMIVAVAILSMTRNSDSAAVIGFFAGLLTGGVANNKMGAYIISRVLAALAASAVGRSSVAISRLTAVLAAAAATGTGAVAFLLVGIPGNLLAWVGATLGTLVYNVVLVFVWSLLFSGRLKRDSFG